MTVTELVTGNGRTRYVIVADNGELVAPAARYLKYLDLCGKTRNTLRTYAGSLAFYFTFLRQKGLAFERVQIADLAGFVRWLKRTDWPWGVAFPRQIWSNRTINLHLGVVSGFYEYAWLSPEMTLVYARVSEDTMRKQWEEAMARGAVHVASAGPQPIDPNELIAGNELEPAYIRGNLDATRVETGYCFKPLKMECPFVEIACFTCHNHVTSTDFLPQFQRQERDLLEQIDLGDRCRPTALGRPRTRRSSRLSNLSSALSNNSVCMGCQRVSASTDIVSGHGCRKSRQRESLDDCSETDVGA